MTAEKDVPHLSSEQSVGDVWIAQMDRKRVPQARSSGCKSTVLTVLCAGRHNPSVSDD